MEKITKQSYMMMLRLEYDSSLVKGLYERIESFIHTDDNYLFYIIRRPDNSISGIEQGYANGYIGIPMTHPLFCTHCEEIDVYIHGGLTYSNKVGNYRIVGFDTGHLNDNKYNCDREFCIKETERLLDQLRKLNGK